MNNLSDRQYAIRTVTNEKEQLLSIARIILSLTTREGNRHNVEDRLLQMVSHLSIIAGFCDSKSKKEIEMINEAFRRGFDLSLNAYETWYKNHLKKLLVDILAIQVDFESKPFKISLPKIDLSIFRLQ